MSTRSKWRQRRLILIIIIVAIIAILIFGAKLLTQRKIESSSNLVRFWRVKSIVMDGNEVTSDYRTKSLTFFKDEKLLLPRHKETPAMKPLTYDSWKHTRIGLVDGRVQVQDNGQSLFDGEYDIEIVSRKPQILLLQSEHIQIVVEERPEFSIDNTTIPID